MSLRIHQTSLTIVESSYARITDLFSGIMWVFGKLSLSGSQICTSQDSPEGGAAEPVVMFCFGLTGGGGGAVFSLLSTN